MGVHQNARNSAERRRSSNQRSDPAPSATDARNAYHAQKSVFRIILFKSLRELCHDSFSESRSSGKRTPTKFVSASPRRSPLSPSRRILNTPQYVVNPTHTHTLALTKYNKKGKGALCRKEEEVHPRPVVSNVRATRTTVWRP